VLICLETSNLFVLVEWFHQKDYPLCAEVGASGSIQCQQFIGGAIPPGSSGAPSKRRIHAGSVGLHAALIVHVKPIAAGGMVPPERLPTACKVGASGSI